jgi:hypothetical protein
MTAFFDDIAKQVSSLGDHDFIDQLIQIERELIRTVSLATGDREFPESHREKIQGIIAVKGIQPVSTLPVNEKQKEIAEMMHYSELAMELHSAFHALGRERRQTRFGMLFDDPFGINVLRDAHDAEAFSATT